MMSSSVGGGGASSEVITPPQGARGQTILGWVFVGLTGLLLLMMTYFVTAVVGPITESSEVFERILASYENDVVRSADQGDIQQADELTIDLLVVLEYANWDIRAAGIQIAFSLVAGLFFATLGVVLFAAGVTGAISLSGSSSAGGFNLNSASPGLVAIALGALIICFGVTKDVSRPMQASVRRALDVGYAESLTKPNAATSGEESPSNLRDELGDTASQPNSTPNP